MNKSLLASLSAATALLALALPAQAATVVDTGTPNGQAVTALAFDSNDWADAQVSFASASTINQIQGHILGGATGETFDISLLANDGRFGPGDVLYTTTATFGSDGWNGASLSGWNVAAGSYWVEFEIQGADTLGSSSVTGALLDLGAPNPVANTVSTGDAGFTYQASPLSFGLRVDASVVSAVPESSSTALMLAGLAWLFVPAFVRRKR